MKQFLHRVFLSLYLTLTLTVVFLFMSVRIGVGSNSAHSYYSFIPLLQVTQTNYEIVLNNISKSLSGEKEYRVQVCALRKKVKDITALEQSCGQITLVVEEVDGYYKYLTSALTGYSEVLNTLKELKSKHGFEGSFIVSYQNGVRISSLHSAKTTLIQSSVKHTIIDSAKAKPIEAIPAPPAVEIPKRIKISLQRLKLNSQFRY